MNKLRRGMNEVLNKAIEAPLGVKIFGGLLLATGIVVGSNIGPEKEDPGQKHPTATELAEQSGMSVSEFPRHDQGTKGSERYCEEIGAKVVTNIALEAGWIACRWADETFTLPPGDSDSSNDQSLYDVCNAVDGHVEGVAVGYGDPFSIPACIAPIKK